MGVERLQQELRRRRRRDGTSQNDVLRGNTLSIESLVAAVVRAECGSGERNTREQPTRAGIRENFGAESNVGLSGGVPADGSCGGGSIATDFNFAGEDAAGGTLAHEKQNEVSGLAANLKTETAAFESHHAGSTPRAAHVIAGAAGHDAATVAGADNKGSFEDGWEDDDTVGFVDDALRNIVRDVHNFFHDFPCVLDTVLFFRLRVGGEGERGREHKG